MELILVIPSPDGKRSMMKLSQRMVSNFCSSISTSNSHQWTTLSGMNEVGVRVAVHKSTDPGQPNGVVLNAATSFWLPVSPQNVFNFFKDERTRSQVHDAPRFHSDHSRFMLIASLTGLFSLVGCPFQRQCSSRSCPYSKWLTSGKLHICPSSKIITGSFSYLFKRFQLIFILSNPLLFFIFCCGVLGVI